MHWLPRANLDERRGRSDPMYCRSNEVPDARANAIPDVGADAQPDAEPDARPNTSVWNRPVLA